MISHINAITLIMLTALGIQMTFKQSAKVHTKIRKDFRAHTLRKVYPQRDKGKFRFKLKEVILDENIIK